MCYDFDLLLNEFEMDFNDLSRRSINFREPPTKGGGGRMYFCKLHTLVALRGQKSKKNGYLRIQGRMQIFEKKSQKALNHVLIG